MKAPGVGAVRPGPPVCEPVWSSREGVVGVDLSAFQQAGKSVAALFSPGQGVMGQVSSSGVVVTVEGAPLDALEAEHMVAVVDVDPVKQVMLLSGPGEPSAWGAVLYLVLRYRQERAAVLGLLGPASSGTTRASDRDPETRRSDGGPAPSGQGLGGASSRGWGFQESAAADAEPVVPASESLVQWARWALEGLRKGPVAALPQRQGLAVDQDLRGAARRLHEMSALQ